MLCTIIGDGVPVIPVELKRQIKQANDILDVVSAYLPVHTVGKSHKAICPFHSDTRPSLQIDSHYQNFRCWSCDARGDVFDFVMRYEKVEFPEALRMLADRVGITLTHESNPQDEIRSRLLRIMKWAEEKYSRCYLDDPIAQSARLYLNTRGISGQSVRQFGLGFAPQTGDWLYQHAQRDRISTADLVEVGLIAHRDNNNGFYDRFRDRVIFPIRDVRGQTVGFGGRILPESPFAARSAKYYNSAETPLFKKSDLIYALDLARHPGSEAKFLAVVEGYTDVIMAHQFGVKNVVATMGTALTASHVLQLRRYVPKVVLVYDADAGGMNGVDRALELFISQDVELSVATLPAGLDPCDLMQQPDGVKRFQEVLGQAQDALEFKLNQLLQTHSVHAVEGQRRVIDAILSIMALAPAIPNSAGQVRQELMITRVAQRVGIRQETLWSRLKELKSQQRRQEAQQNPSPNTPTPPPRIQTQGAHNIERQLLEVLLAEPALLPEAKKQITLDQVTHSGLRRLLSELYALLESGSPADLDGLRVRLMDRPDLAHAAARLQEVGRSMKEYSLCLERIIQGFSARENSDMKKTINAQLATASADEQDTVALLRKLQERGQTKTSNGPSLTMENQGQESP